MPQIREKKFRQQEIDLDQFTDEELFSKNGFGRESVQYLVEILKNDLERKTRRKHMPVTRILYGGGRGGANETKVDQTTEMYIFFCLIRLFRKVAIHEIL